MVVYCEWTTVETKDAAYIDQDSAMWLREGINLQEKTWFPEAGSSHSIIPSLDQFRFNPNGSSVVSFWLLWV